VIFHIEDNRWPVNVGEVAVKEYELLAAHLKKTRPVEWEAIVRHGSAITEILVEFRFDGMMGKNQHRVYEVRRSPAGSYYSSVSGGQEQWTTEKTGPNDEPIEKRREWVVSESGGYIGSFETLEMLAIMILHQLRGRDVFVVSELRTHE
jgi:hypothetical protein